MENKRPRGRQKNITGSGTGVFKRGDGLGTGPTGESGLGKNPGGSQQKSSQDTQRSTGSSKQENVNPYSQQKNVNPYSQQGRTGMSGGQQFGSGLFGTGTQNSTSQNYSAQNQPVQSSNVQNTQTTRSGGRGKLFLLLIIVVVAVVLLFVLCGRGSRDQSVVQPNTNYTQNTTQATTAASSGSSVSDQSYYGSYNDFFNSWFGGNGSYSTGWTDSSAASASLNTSVAEGTRDKRTQILGGGRDTVTIMVYMCGADLESKSGMASSDLQEMTKASLGNINLIVYTGGASRWMNSVVSSSTNQIYQVVEGGVVCINDNAGRVSMTDPSTLSSFITWTASNYPANRYELIFWDHGAGTVDGYGYDEKFPNSGSMGLSGINKALKNAGVTFDFIGFDTCLMATMENALMLDSYADYLIASEETEPGYGWYYTDWLTDLAANTSMPTIEIGKNIVDDFITTSAKQAQGQKATLSVVDLAELSSTARTPFSEFSKSMSDLISGKEYKLVSDARNQTREFGSSSKIDMVDLVHLAQNLGNEEGTELAQILRNAIKYNRTSSGLTNAYGLSIFFPYQSVKYVDRVTNTYNEIGMDEAYTKCIRSFASLEVCGQAATGGSTSPFGSLFGDSYGSYNPYSSYGYSGSSSSGSYSSYSSSSDMISDMLGSFLGGDYSSIFGLSGRSAFVAERSMNDEEVLQYILDNSIDMADLVFEEYSDGSYRMELTEKEWSLIHSIDLNMFYDDGEGYINLGLDGVFDFDDENRLVADNGETWISINGQPVSYFHMDTMDDGENYVITGRVPAILNEEDRIDLILVFDNENPNGYIAGAYYVYDNDDQVIVPKNLTELNIGDTLDFICDYYDYNGNYIESYYIGNQMTVSDDMVISDTYLDADKVLITYKLTDIYNQAYWTVPLER